MRTLSSIRKRKVVSESGQSLGRCQDVRGELTRSGLRVTALVVGRHGRLEHLGVEAQAGATPDRVHTGDVIPWEDIVRFEGDTIVVTDSAAEAFEKAG